MFCFKCGASMPEDTTVCPQCAAPVQAMPTPPPPPQQPSTPNPASTSAWLNVPPAFSQQAQQYPAQAQPYRPYQPPKTDSCASGSGGTDEHASLLVSRMGQPYCTSGLWCQKGQYQFCIYCNGVPIQL